MLVKNNEMDLSPILKWAGGKRQLLDVIRPLIPKKISTYIEPFLGGGAVFFDLKPKKAIINDYNEELMNIYRIIKTHPNELIELLELHNENNNEEYFYKIRKLDRKEKYSKLTNIQKAARIIYLNKTCYNGLYRVNQLGQFNTPYGKYKNPKIVDTQTIKNMSLYFNNNNIKIISGDYRDALKNVRKGAFIYFDPPYFPLSTSSSFTGYTNDGFSYDDQVNLKMVCDKLNKREIKFLLSNSDHSLIRELYSDYIIETVKARRAINANAEKRGEINELLIRNYD